MKRERREHAETTEPNQKRREHHRAEKAQKRRKQSGRETRVVQRGIMVAGVMTDVVCSRMMTKIGLSAYIRDRVEMPIANMMPVRQTDVMRIKHMSGVVVKLRGIAMPAQMANSMAYSADEQREQGVACSAKETCGEHDIKSCHLGHSPSFLRRWSHNYPPGIRNAPT